jgi:hypothetical protein
VLWHRYSIAMHIFVRADQHLANLDTSKQYT